MSVLYLLIPIAIIFLIIAVAFFFWAIGNSQYDDMDSPALKVVMDDHQLNKKNFKGFKKLIEKSWYVQRYLS